MKILPWLAMGLLLAAPLAAQEFDPGKVITGISREDLSVFLRSLGYAPSNVKERTLKLEIGGFSSFISVNNDDLQLYTWFAGPADPARVNRFNESYRFSCAYYDSENDVCVQSDLDLAGGVTCGAIKGWIAIYADLLKSWDESE